MDQHRHLFTYDKTSHLLKVVNVEDSEAGIIAVTRWHRYDGPYVAEARPSFEISAFWDGSSEKLRI